MNQSALRSFNGIVRELHLGAARSGLLAGRTFVAKDLFDVAGYVTGAGNPTWLETHRAASVSASSIERLTGSGANLVGKSCSDELAFSLDGINIHYGTPINPQLPECIPGGSSSGSASATASGLVDFAIGTDTSGSVRVPASYCGVYGFRPTHGRVPIDGVVPLGPDFDTVGWFARDPQTLELCGQVLLGASGSLERASCLYIVPEALALISQDIAQPVIAAISRLERRFAHAAHWDLDIKALQEWLSCFGLIRGRQAWECHGEWIEKYHPLFAPEILERFMQGKRVTAEERAQAEVVRRRAVDRILSTIKETSVVCVPTACGLPPLKSASEQQLAATRKANMLLCSIASVAGLPQMTVPISVTDRVRTGISFIGAPGTDMMLLHLAGELSEQVSGTKGS